VRRAGFVRPCVCVSSRLPELDTSNSFDATISSAAGLFPACKHI